jgi:Cu/Ag efflux protein CusF
MIRLPKWLLVVLALAVLVAFAAPLVAEETKGKIKSVSADKKEFVMTDNNGKDWEFTLTDEGKVTLGDKDIKLNELKEGDHVTITYEKKDNKLMASEVKVRRE